MSAQPIVGGWNRITGWLPLAVILTLAAPTLFLRYLPMTDLPQHLAVASMWLHWDDPRFGFDEFYELAPWRTLYLLPYAAVVGLAQILPLEVAMRIVVFASVIAVPLGLLAFYRVTDRASVLALLALPLMYDRAFFWGFINFKLALGMSILAIAWLERPRRSAGRDLALAALCAAISLTHVYGILLVAGYAGLWLLIGERRALLRRFHTLAPLAIGTAIWLFLGRDAEGRGRLHFDSLAERFWRFEENVLGGYMGFAEELLLVLLLAALAFFCAPALPWSAGRWRALCRRDRVVLLLAALNFALYWFAPTHTESALFVHFRHALLALTLLPLLARDDALASSPLLSRGLLSLIAVASLGIHWPQLLRFDREARTFDAVVAKIPDRPKLLFLSWDRLGNVVRTNPYHHFHAYVLARRGGVVGFSFPEMFWNIPVRLRDDSGVPQLSKRMEWQPQSYDDDTVSGFYDWVLVRSSPDGGGSVEDLEEFSYERVVAAPPWELYHRVGAVE